MDALRVLHDPSTSDWLRGAITALMERDIVDAVNDCEVLLKTMEDRMNAIAAWHVSAGHCK